MTHRDQFRGSMKGWQHHNPFYQDFDPVTGLPKDTFHRAMQCRQNNESSNESRHRIPAANSRLHAPAAHPHPQPAHQEMHDSSRVPSKSLETEAAAAGCITLSGHLGTAGCLRLEKCVPAAHVVVPRLSLTPGHLRIVKIASHVFWLVFCMLGLAYHLQTVCDGYFRYATTTDTVIDIASRFRPPALTVCFDSTSIRRRRSSSSSRKGAADVVDPHGANMLEADLHDCPPPPPPSPFSPPQPRDRRHRHRQRRQESGSKEGKEGSQFKQKKSYQEMGSSEIRDTCHFLMNNMSLKEIANLTHDFGDLIQQIWYRDPDSYDSVLLNQSNDSEEFEFYVKRHVRTRFKGRMKCFIDRPIPLDSDSSSGGGIPVAEQFNASIIPITSSNSESSRNANNSPSMPPSSFSTTTTRTTIGGGTSIQTGYNTLMIADAETEGVILRLYFKQMTASPYRYERERQRRNHPVPDMIKVFIHESDREPRGYLSPGLLFNLTQYRTIIVSYQKVINILLPPPFPSACRVYDHESNIDLENSYSNQKDCMEHCLDLGPGDGRLSPTTVHRMDEEKLLRDYDSREQRSSCVKSCPLPCTRTEYFARLGSQAESGDGTIALGPGEAEIVVTFKARTEPFEFVIFIAGCFNLWFGVAVYGSTIDICRDMVKQFLVPAHSFSRNNSSIRRSRESSDYSLREAGKSVRIRSGEAQRQRRQSHASDRKRIPAASGTAGGGDGREQNSEQCTMADVPERHRKEEGKGDAGHVKNKEDQRKKKGSKISSSSHCSVISVEHGTSGARRIPQASTSFIPATMKTTSMNESPAGAAVTFSSLISSFFSPARKKITDLAGRMYHSLQRILTVHLKDDSSDGIIIDGRRHCQASQGHR